LLLNRLENLYLMLLTYLSNCRHQTWLLVRQKYFISQHDQSHDQRLYLLPSYDKWQRWMAMGENRFGLQKFIKYLPAKRPPKNVKGMHVGRGSRVVGRFFFCLFTNFGSPPPTSIKSFPQAVGHRKLRKDCRTHGLFFQWGVIIRTRIYCAGIEKAVTLTQQHNFFFIYRRPQNVRSDFFL
jgi:hypothetical protein